MSDSSHRVVFVTGSTATGKSEWALRVAERTGAVVVNCDSVQLYEDVVIGSGLPSEGDFARADHRLYSYVAPPAEMTAGDYRRDFFELMTALPPASKVLVVGGTGFYFQALEKGMFETPPVDPEISERVRRDLEEKGGEALWRELHSSDPETAARLAVGDSYRISRAVELCRAGIKPSEHRKGFTPEPFPFPLLKTRVGRDREELRERIRRRTEDMIERGLLNEIRALLERGLESWAPLASVGYKEGVAALRENRSEDWLLEEICLRTGQLAKRQETWFKRDPEIEVFQGDSLFSEFQDRVLRFLRGDGRLGSP
ncbi:MAG TPA: tRNA (adenosine(37)-N6)-dimethylallyltransferase MiaA [Pseudobdellovibrionaceae bacterium]|nr:tRNA (adenosine(37)-N6)-dimethylallyltransferase MiaA [Pseudobdellovibrionaceae bacterium]